MTCQKCTISNTAVSKSLQDLREIYLLFSNLYFQIERFEKEDHGENICFAFPMKMSLELLLAQINRLEVVGKYRTA